METVSNSIKLRRSKCDNCNHNGGLHAAVYPFRCCAWLHSARCDCQSFTHVTEYNNILRDLCSK